MNQAMIKMVSFNELAKIISNNKNMNVIIKGSIHQAFVAFKKAQICLKRFVYLFSAILLLKKKKRFKNVLKNNYFKCAFTINRTYNNRLEITNYLNLVSVLFYYVIKK
jgi:hypothetical protein